MAGCGSITVWVWLDCLVGLVGLVWLGWDWFWFWVGLTKKSSWLEVVVIGIDLVWFTLV